jgi:O-antigen/teichoic acid export membrane protein
METPGDSARMERSGLAVWGTRAGRLALGASANAIGAVGGAIRNKLFAHFLGTEGLGALAQVLAAQTWAGTLAGLGLTVPVTVAVGAAHAAGDTVDIRRTVRAALGLVAAGTAAMGIAGLLFAGPLARLLLGPHADPTLIAIGVLGMAGIAFQATIQALFAGRSDVRATVTYAAIGNLVAVAAVAALVPAFGLRGAVLGVALFWPVAIAGTLWRHRADYASYFAPAPAGGGRGEARALLKVALGALALSFLDQGTMLAIRTHYARTQGFDANGLLQAALALSQQVGAVFYAYLGSYAFGKVSGAAGAAGIADYTRRQAAAFLAAAAVAFAAAMLLASPLLRLFYSSRFDPAQPLMAWTMFGEFAKVGMQAWMFGALPLGGLRLFMPLGASYPLAMAVGYAAATALGAGRMSVPAAYAFAACTALTVSGIVMSARGVAFTPRALLVLGLGLVGLAALAGVRG